MKVMRVVAIACLSLVLLSDMSFAQSRRNTLPSTAGASGTTCTTGQTCAADCDAMGWCSRMVCSGNKWEKRLLSCIGPLCPPKC
jgi:hypothetical protein